MRRALTYLFFLLAIAVNMQAQVNTDRVMAIGRNALYFEDYVLSIQYFNQVIKAKPWMAEPYFYRAVAKLNLDDFQGAEEDCTLSLERNPFLAQAYYARGIARQSLEKYAGAIEDYTKGLEFKPDDRAMMSNKAIAYVQKKDFTDAEQVFEELIRAHPKQSLGYLTRAAMYLEKGDTAKALSDYDRAIALDSFYAPCYANRALTLYQSGRYTEALKDLNQAIRLNTREPGYYINRGLVRYELNDLRGAMADYDQVIEMDADNRIARYNRATLLFKTGDYRATIRDLDAVLRRYPDFVQGYYYRADVKRRLNDLKGADRDYIAAMKIEEDRRRGRRSVASTAAKDSTRSGANDRTREESDRNIEKFSRLVVYDRKKEQKSKYQSEIRGRVQDRNVQVELEPMFVLTYYERQADVRERVFYDRLVERFNDRRVLAWRLLLTNREAALTEEQIAAHFASIDSYSKRIERTPGNADLHFGRALDYLLVQDFTEALHDLDRTVELAPDAAPLAYFARAVVRYKQLESARSQQPDVTSAAASPFRFGAAATRPSTSADTRDPSPADEARRHEHELILRDYDQVIRLAPDFAFAYFNRGNLRCTGRDFRAAIADYDEAIRRDPELAEAYFNRGLAELSMGNATRGIADLSKAGELGLPSAYSIIRRMTEESKSNE